MEEPRVLNSGIYQRERRKEIDVHLEDKRIKDSFHSMSMSLKMTRSIRTFGSVEKPERTTA